MHRVLGIDPGSRNTGLAVVEGDKLFFSHQKVLPHSNATSEGVAANMYSFKLAINFLIEEYGPSLIVTEHTSVHRNLNTTKMLTYFEAMALLAAAEKGLLVERVRTKQARKAVCGSGTMDKSDLQDWVYKKYNQTYGQDEAEAIIFALYGNTILMEDSPVESLNT